MTNDFLSFVDDILLNSTIEHWWFQFIFIEVTYLNDFDVSSNYDDMIHTL